MSVYIIHVYICFLSNLMSIIVGTHNIQCPLTVIMAMKIHPCTGTFIDIISLNILHISSQPYMYVYLKSTDLEELESCNEITDVATQWFQ